MDFTLSLLRVILWVILFFVILSNFVMVRMMIKGVREERRRTKNQERERVRLERQREGLRLVK